MDKDDIVKDIGLKIRTIRENKKLSIMDLADKLDIKLIDIVDVE